MEFSHVDDSPDYPIHARSICSGIMYSFTREGRYYYGETGECVLFPSKDNRDWNNISFKKDLPIDTPVAVFNRIHNVKASNICSIKIRYYAGRGRAFNDGYNSCNSHGDSKWNYIIPIDKFDFENASFNKCDNYGSITW